MTDLEIASFAISASFVISAAIVRSDTIRMTSAQRTKHYNIASLKRPEFIGSARMRARAKRFHNRREAMMIRSGGYRSRRLNAIVQSNGGGVDVCRPAAVE